MAEEKKESGKKRIEYHKESVYGVHKNYYNDKDVGRHMHALTGQKTLNDAHIEHLRALGHEVEEVPVSGAQMQSGQPSAPAPKMPRMGSSNGYMVGGGGQDDNSAAAA